MILLRTVRQNQMQKSADASLHPRFFGPEAGWEKRRPLAAKAAYYKKPRIAILCFTICGFQKSPDCDVGFYSMRL